MKKLDIDEDQCYITEEVVFFTRTPIIMFTCLYGVTLSASSRDPGGSPLFVVKDSTELIFLWKIVPAVADTYRAAYPVIAGRSVCSWLTRVRNPMMRQTTLCTEQQ